MADKVTFIYAVRDDMFADEKQRAKFFEFILPVVPIINPITTADNIRKISDTLDNINNSLALSEQFIKDISYFVSDMRVLKNAFNDYIIMANKLSENNEKRLLLKKENLFALALYKNLYPYDYSRLMTNSGLIPLCVDKDIIVKQYVESLQNKIKEKEIEKDKINKEMVMDFDELKLIFKAQHQDISCHSGLRAKSVDQIDTFKDVSQLAHPRNPQYFVPLQKLPNGDTYYDREKRIKAKCEKGLRAVEDEIRELYKEIDDIENKTFHALITQIGIVKYFSEERLAAIKAEYKEIIANKIFYGDQTEKLPEEEKNKEDKLIAEQIDYIRMLINKDYIDENYMEYISAYKSELSVNDREFISNVKKGYCKSYNYRLDNVTAVIRELTEEDFLQPAIIINDICRSLYVIKEIDNENDIKTTKFNHLIKLLSSCKESVVRAVCAFLMIAEHEEKCAFGKYIVDNCVVLVEALFRATLSAEDKDMFIQLLVSNGKDISKMDEVRQYISEHEHYTTLVKGVDLDNQFEFISKWHIVFEKLDISSGRDDLFDYIVQNNFYVLNVDNIKLVLDVDENNAEQFEKKNYTFIQQSNNQTLKERIEKDMDSYIGYVFVKLPVSTESEDVIKTFLTNETIGLENKIRVISHTDFKVEILSNVDSSFYVQLLNENKVFATWDNIIHAYKVLGFDESIKNFINSNSGDIKGKFSDIDDATQGKIFNDIVATELDDSVINGIGKSMDVQFNMNAPFGSDNRIGSFILAGCFAFNVDDMRLLKNPPSTIPYLIVYQKEIQADMRAFFGNTTFKTSTVRNIIEEPKIGKEFKKEFVFLYGGNFDINGIEDIVAKFAVDNDCAVDEKLLYKFTNTILSASLKMALLSLAVKTGTINDLNSYRSYFCAIDEDYSKFWNESKKLVINNTIQNRLVAEFMKKNGLIIRFITKKDKLYLSCA